jgi:(2Fe-2S) ferredoxin
MAVSPERCAPAAERRGDHLYATAAPAERFVLVEEPGAWGRNALRESRLGASVLAGLLARCHAANARLLLVRRAHRPPEVRRWAIADARPGSEATWWGTFEEDDDLCDLDPAAPRGTVTDEPTFLVCTHGRRDPCCAGRGWPVAVALTEEFPEQTWQCSHVGGDRFAANVVILPHGLYYGRVTPDDAVPIARRHLAGGVTVESLRGRSTFAPAGQAAQHFARLEHGVDRIDALQPIDVTPGPDGTVVVRLAHGDEVVSVRLREHESEPIPRLTCGARVATPIREWELVSLQ